MYDDHLPEYTVTLRCKNEYMKNIMDCFREDIETTLIKRRIISARMSVVSSSALFGWSMQCRGGILIEKPVKVRREDENMLSEILTDQQSL